MVERWKFITSVRASSPVVNMVDFTLGEMGSLW